jgi:hypothetical protein
VNLRKKESKEEKSRKSKGKYYWKNTYLEVSENIETVFKKRL